MKAITITSTNLIFKFVIIVIAAMTVLLSTGFVHANQNRPTHWIVLIHGLGGDASTWGYAEQALKKQLEEIQPQYQVQTENFAYPSGEKHLRTFDFAEKYLGPFLSQKINAHNLRDQDRITLIGHSQGGTIATIWYGDALLDTLKSAEETIIAKHVDQIITIGTPFWGSKLATRFTDNSKLNWSKIAFLESLAKFNRAEIQDLSLGDNTEYKFRRTAIAASRKPSINSIFKARMVNISGVLPTNPNALFIPIKELENKSLQETWAAKIGRQFVQFMYSYFAKSKFGGNRPESDSAVMAPSSRMEFIYTDNLQNESENLNFENFKDSNIFSDSEFIVTESLHAPVDLSTQVGMASIPRTCIVNRQCAHPTFGYILDSAANCKYSNCIDTYLSERKLLNSDVEWRKASKTIENTLQGFTLDITVRLPSDYVLPDDLWQQRSGPEELSGSPFFKVDNLFSRYIHFQTTGLEQQFPQHQYVDIQVARKGELYSQTAKLREISFRDKSHTDLRLTVTGIIKPNLLAQSHPVDYKNAMSKGFALPVTVELPGLKIQKIIAKIKPVFSTYVEYSAKLISK